MNQKLRIDQILANQGLAPSRQRAQALIMAGKVLVNEQRVEKASECFNPETITIRLKGLDHPYVSRGGVKLAGALDYFKLDPKGKICLDVGASTGGFTDCLLQRGAQRVYAWDVGHGQMDFRLRQDPRVILREGFNVREVLAQDLSEPIDLVVMDVSFISLQKILQPFQQAFQFPWLGLFLLKPQFEGGRHQVEKGGVVRDETVRQAILQDFVQWLEKHKLQCLGTVPSQLKGAKGNQEYFLLVRKPGL